MFTLINYIIIRIIVAKIGTRWYSFYNFGIRFFKENELLWLKYINMIERTFLYIFIGLMNLYTV